MKELYLDMTRQGDALKLVWSCPEFVMSPYCIAAAAAQTGSDKVRNILKTIASKYINPQADYKDEIPLLRRAGFELMTVLFENIVDGSADSAEEVKNYIETIRDRKVLRIRTDGMIPILWNFVFDGDPDATRPFTHSLADFGDFWLSKFKVFIRFNKVKIPPEWPLPRSSVKTLLALNEEEFVKARQSISCSRPDTKEKINSLLSFEVGSVTNWDDCRAKWRVIAEKNDSILYIFGHSTGEEIFLTAQTADLTDQERFRYVLDANSFLATFKKSRNPTSNTICFINGCRTADGSLGKNFLNVTSGKGFHGFIGSEAEISNEHSTYYATEFLYKLLQEGRSVEEAFEELREPLFPASLWYSCYADPLFQISPNS